MNRSRALSVIAFLLALQLACLFGPSATPVGIPSTGRTPSAQAIGSIRQIQGGVEAGPESALEAVNPSRDLYDNEAARVFNNGKALLDFGYDLTVTLYNDTTTTGTRAAASNQVAAKLSQGGLLGYNPPGSRTEVQLPNNATIVILGTHYFITYDPASRVGSAFNFDGSMSYALGGGSPVELPQHDLVVFDATGVIKIFTGLQFTPEGFDGYASSHNSPLLGLAAMEKEYPVPAAPQPTSPENGAILSAEPTLQWNPVDQGRGYQIQVSADPAFSTNAFDTAVDGSQWAVPAPLPMSVYYWRVRGLSPFSVPGPWGETRSFSFSIAPEAPILQNPGDGELVMNSQPGFSWTAVGNAARYQIQVGYQPDFSSPAFDASAGGTSWTPPGSLPGGSYYWRVRALNGYETAGPWSAPRSFTVSLLPDAPALVDPADHFVMNEAAAGFSWQPAGNAVRYQVQVSYDDGFNQIIYDSPASTTYWAAPGSLPMGQYYWRVRGFNNLEQSGPWSNSRSFVVSVPPGVPLLRGPFDGAVKYQNDPLVFSWGDAAGASYYQIQVIERGGTFRDPLYDQSVRDGTWTLPGLLRAGRYYYWRVRALNQYGDPGDWSDNWRFYMQGSVE